MGGSPTQESPDYATDFTPLNFAPFDRDFFHHAHETQGAQYVDLYVGFVFLFLWFFALFCFIKEVHVHLILLTLYILNRMFSY